MASMGYLDLTNFSKWLIMTGVPPVEWKAGHPYSSRFQDIYYPPQDGIGAARHVFIDAQDLPARLLVSDCFTVGELGFGTGLNFLTLLSLWKSLPRKPQLTFVSCEKYPLTPDELEKALSRFPSLKEEARQLVNSYPFCTPGFHSVRFEDDRVHLLLLIGDATTELKEFSGKVDAWFLDGFNPRHNPELWSEELFSVLADHSHKSTTLATWSVAGTVRRTLSETGFSIQKIKGFGQKKESLVGYYDQGASKENIFALQNQSAVVVGAGIAGCSLAHVLARRGCKVTVIDAEDRIAAGASGNRLGLVVPYFTEKPTSLSEMYISGYSRMLQKISALSLHHDLQWKNPGALHLPVTKRLERLLQSIERENQFDSRLVSACPPEVASKVAGVPVEHNCFRYPLAGFLNPPAYCQALLADDKISVITGRKVKELITASDNSIKVIDTAGDLIIEASLFFLCTAWQASSFSVTEQISTNKVRGQLLSSVSATEASKNLRTLLCYDGYCTPEVSGTHCVGVSYARTDESAVSTAETRQILERLNHNFPALDISEVNDARVSFRATTFDRFPIAGSLPDVAAVKQQLRTAGAGDKIYRTSVNGAYVLTGLGSRGLISSMLLSELIVDKLQGQALPLAKRVEKAVHPVRLLIRDWKQEQKRTGNE